MMAIIIKGVKVIKHLPSIRNTFRQFLNNDTYLKKIDTHLNFMFYLYIKGKKAKLNIFA